MRTLLLAPVPTLIIAVLIVVTSLPWGGPDWLELAMSLLPIAAIHYWSVRRPWLMPPPVVFVLGLFADAITNGPLGVWTAAALVAALAGRLFRTEWNNTGAVGRFVVAVAALALVVCLVGAVTSLHGGRLVPSRPLLEALAAACLAYPVLSVLLTALDGLWPMSEERSLLLRGD